MRCFGMSWLGFLVLLLQRRADWVGGSNSGHTVLLLLGWHEQKEGGTTYDAGHAGQGSGAQTHT